MGESVQGALPVSRKNEFPFEILFGALGVHNPTFSIQVRITETKLNANPNTTPNPNPTNPTYPGDPTKPPPCDGVGLRTCCNGAELLQDTHCVAVLFERYLVKILHFCINLRNTPCGVLISARLRLRLQDVCDILIFYRTNGEKI